MAAIVTIATAPTPPARLQLGADSVAAIEEKLRKVTAELSQWRELAVLTAYDDAAYASTSGTVSPPDRQHGLRRGEAAVVGDDAAQVRTGSRGAAVE